MNTPAQTLATPSYRVTINGKEYKVYRELEDARIAVDALGIWGKVAIIEPVMQ